MSVSKKRKVKKTIHNMQNTLQFCGKSEIDEGVFVSFKLVKNYL